MSVRTSLFLALRYPLLCEGPYNVGMLTKALADAECVFTAKRFSVRSLEVPGHDGALFRKEVIVHPGAVVILPLLGSVTQHEVIMIRNERIATGQTLWELPAGTLEPSPGMRPATSGQEPAPGPLEAPDRCAARELIEETGYEAGKITKLLEFYTTPGFCTELMHAYVATDLTYVGQRLEPSESLTVEVQTWDQTMQMVRDNVIRDGKSIATLLYYRAYGRSKA